ncbi:MAG TPA: NUDIX hydrolase [Candidatus Polarisedimenticolia bacterium]|nr:NUDIX hydrolase [Candidatus Polarisedimenticolia bacterium]
MTAPSRQPRLTADVIIIRPAEPRRIVLVRRRNPPNGWALPGGFVDYGESVETAAAREALEETGLRVRILRQFHVYSEPDRDPRGHTVTVVFLGEAAEGEPVGGDDAAEARFFDADALPAHVAFDHAAIVGDYLAGRY